MTKEEFIKKFEDEIEELKNTIVELQSQVDYFRNESDNRRSHTRDAMCEVVIAKAELEALKAENQKAREVIEFYADKENWGCPDEDSTNADIICFDWDERNNETGMRYAGYTARAFLASHPARDDGGEK